MQAVTAFLPVFPGARGRRPEQVRSSLLLCFQRLQSRLQRLRFRLQRVRLPLQRLRFTLQRLRFTLQRLRSSLRRHVPCTQSRVSCLQSRASSLQSRASYLQSHRRALSYARSVIDISGARSWQSLFEAGKRHIPGVKWKRQVPGCRPLQVFFGMNNKRRSDLAALQIQGKSCLYICKP